MTKIKIEKIVAGVLLFFSFYFILLSLSNVYRISFIYTFEVLIGYLIFLVITLRMFPLNEEYFDFQKFYTYRYKRFRRLILFVIIGSLVFLIYFIILFKTHGFDFTLESVEIYEKSEFVQIFSNVFLSVGSGILTAFGIRLHKYYK